VYLVYGRRWFADDVNHVNRLPLDMRLEHYAELPEAVRPLLVRAYTHAIRLRWHEADGRGLAQQRSEPPPAAADPSTWGKPGRNDPCPCGSGKKYKHCHGRNP
jgi:preprotein translocase subunit SecA